MISISDLVKQLRMGIRNLFLLVLGFFKIPRQLFNKTFAPRVEEDEIPESWLKPESVESVELISQITPVAVEPSIVFEEPTAKIFTVKSFPWVIKVKRLLAFFVFFGCLISTFGLVTTFPLGLAFVIPTAVINLDYLLKTQPKKTKYAMHILDDMED